jgi:ribonuclease P protein component
MLPKKVRIKKSLFKDIKTRGIFLNSPYLFLNVYKESEDKNSLFAFSCSKKVNKLAVKRNLLRRRGYSIIKKILPNINKGFYFIFSFKKDADKQDFNILEQNILDLLKQNNFLKK